MGPWEIHPALVHFPIAFLIGGVALDLFGAWRARSDLVWVASGLINAGVLAGFLTAAAGVVAFFTIPGMHADWAHQMVLWHLGLAVLGLIVFCYPLATRRGEGARQPTRAARITGIVALAILGTASFLGGHVVYHGGMGVDPNVEIRPTSAP